MKKVLTVITLTAAILSSCSEGSLEQQGVESLTIVGEVPSVKTITITPTTPPTSSSTILFDFDFEDNNESFRGVLENTPLDKETLIRNISETSYKCNLARGKKTDFITKGSVNFEGNETYFIGRAFNDAIKSGGGWSDTSGKSSCIALYQTKRNLKITKDFDVNELSITYDYYGQDVNTSYIFPAMSIYIYSKTTKKFINLTPPEKGYTWAKYATKIPNKIIAGEYELIVFHAPKGVGIDNIKIYTDTKPSSGSEIKVNAGADATINLPINTFNLNSTITNPKGETIKSILWSKVSGDGVTIFNNDKEDTKVSNLQEGEYVFKVVVTNDKDIEVEDTVTIKVDGSKVLFGFTFEENVEGFTNVNNVVAKIDKYCRGRKANFPAYLGNIYSGNDTFFLGINQGDLNSWINPTSTKSINLTNTYKVNELGIQFSTQSIDPWGDTTKVIVTLKSKSGSEIISFVLQNSNSWVTTNSLINKEVPAGEYIINVEHLGGMTAIDDIYIYEK